MEPVYQALVDRIQAKWSQQQAHQEQSRPRLLIALAGPPGSGKTTIAEQVALRLRQRAPSLRVACVSADGFHLPLATLRALPNATEALARRGAPWTFDGAATAAMVARLRAGAGRQAVVVPSFDHATKDPVAEGLVVGPDVQVCIVEGNYLLCDEAPWSRIAEIVDDRWLVVVDATLARDRVAARHVEAGIERTMEEALARAERNDMVNGEFVMRHSEGRADLVIHSVEEAGQY
ncbi:phosphoribulokinase/uridine kinase [Emericellopsis atlantica]|uniref:Phosphoribulokinase/uridine kinase n=1 Tax=Emericellopsis atlantica TaxID=2614577 RepID=A0A9P7ZQ86_9HYPO|nr:phosphoribulokinase/uridine kinase [Emericellopsis atlantica]KAG9255847.1 phosphoribulokinase/uridine kinase [Emericellopsis atlantica]